MDDKFNKKKTDIELRNTSEKEKEYERIEQERNDTNHYQNSKESKYYYNDYDIIDKQTKLYCYQNLVFCIIEREVQII